MRVYDLAHELNVASKDLLARLRADGVEIKSASSALPEVAVAQLRRHFARSSVLPPVVSAKSAPSPAPLPEKPAPASPPVAKPVAPAVQPVKPKPRQKPKPEVSGVDVPPAAAKPVAPLVITLRGAITVRELAEQLGVKPNQLIAELMGMNVFAAINQRVDLKVVQQIAEKHGAQLEHEKKTPDKPSVTRSADDDVPEMERPEDLEPRPPVVTFLGHIDHGKTSLLDRIRNTAVAKGEAGGITQHIGAYTVERQGKKITFLDTPGHAAFTAMRARGANLTDIAVLVVAADDGIMPQTEEAIKHVQAANTTMMVAINKIDLPGANVDRVKRQLQSLGLTPEEWGGAIVCVEVSAMTGAGVDHLLEMIALQAEVLELKANPHVRAQGFVIEARLEPGMGPTANLLVTNGTLHVGDTIVAGPYCGRVKALINDHGIKVRTVTPSLSAKCMGLSGTPNAGEAFKVYANDRLARDVASNREAELRAAQLGGVSRKATLEALLQAQEQKQSVALNVVLKCDTYGSLEALRKELGEIKSDKVNIVMVLCGVGNINENDVTLASASNAIIVGFNVSKEEGVSQAQKREGVEIRLYSIIYQIADEIRAAMSGLLMPELREKLMGRAEVRQVFPFSKVSKVAGCLVVSGRVHIRHKVRVKRAGNLLYEGGILTLRRFQDEVNEVREGQECGIRLDNFSDFEVADLLEFVDIEKIPQKL